MKPDTPPPCFQQDRFTLHHGDCLDVLKTLADCSVDAIVTDPPYGLSFMGKRWDYDVPTEAVWVECLRVLKPGGHLLAFAGTRTQHRMAVRIEDAGFEIRDMIAWVYGSGFPKSLDVSKAIDKAAGIDREDKFEGAFDRKSGPTGNKKCETCGKWLVSGSPCQCPRPQDQPVTELARQWEGWGTALKPALEPITLARKPLIGTVAANVLEHGTGGLNIDGCRVDYVTVENGNLALNPHLRSCINGGNGGNIIAHEKDRRVVTPHASGRFPANFIHDGSEEVMALFPQTTSGQPAGVKAGNNNNVFGQFAGGIPVTGFGDSGSAARFFYCAKTSKKDRNEGCEALEAGVLARSCQAQAEAKRGNVVECEEGAYNKARLAKNNHPTVKPTDLMRYLCRLVTPPGGLILDPFMGSGSTGKAAMLEGFCFIGVEQEAEYLEIAQARIGAAVKRCDGFLF
jgi:site-specific DNA-methyltransferase (adenine-specific)